ncbi:SocA family protein [Roseibium sp. CAU 1637]|uniref:SocA family protein n=1 Tax=Roseibium limicola TaxID=2816037 RepID=A0A939J9V9_9HYPH|nr:type II toxin-antitoxin system antitoxin SocA domain-containing protein [Roseibium limicola]MBO0345803.1 SocA family protein [Roseibium limicola]
MTVSALSAARTLCEERNWNISNLELQKLLYIAELYHLGITEDPLIFEDFEAWDYGPVVPIVYSKARGFGKSAVPNVFHWIDPVKKGSKEFDILSAVAAQTKRLTAGELVNITHWPQGAWAKFYAPHLRNIKIPKMEILREYNDRKIAA